MECIICKGNIYELFTHTSSYLKGIKGNKVKLFKCISCGHGFYPHSKIELLPLYDEDYSKDYLDTKSKTFMQRHIQYLKDVELLLKMVNSKRNLKVLDIGCSQGLFLKSMPNNWNKYGLEVNPTYHKILENSKIGIFSNYKDIKMKFDLITMRGVIEHIADHKELIAFLKTHIKSGGGLFISSTPDFNSPASVILGKYWSQIQFPEHIHQFTSASLQILLLKANLVLREIHYPYLDTAYSNFKVDKKKMLDTKKKKLTEKNTKFPFPGNMISAYFLK